MMGKQAAPEPQLSGASSVRYSMPKPKMNFVKEKMIQIDKIDRGLESSFAHQ